MSVILRNCCPPLVQVAKLGGLCSQVYAVLWESAYKDVRRDKRLHLPYEQRRDCGGTSTWSIKGIASEIGASRNKVGKAVDTLLDAGFLIAEGYVQGGRGTKTTIWRVVHPDQLEAVSYANSMLHASPSETRQVLLKHKITPPEIDHELEQGLRDYYVENFGTDPYSGFDDTVSDEYEGDGDDALASLTPEEVNPEGPIDVAVIS